MPESVMDMHQKHVNKMFRFEVSHIEIVLYRLALRCHGVFATVMAKGSTHVQPHTREKN